MPPKVCLWARAPEEWQLLQGPLSLLIFLWYVLGCSLRITPLGCSFRDDYGELIWSLLSATRLPLSRGPWLCAPTSRRVCLCRGCLLSSGYHAPMHESSVHLPAGHFLPYSPNDLEEWNSRKSISRILHNPPASGRGNTLASPQNRGASPTSCGTG
jgi:hypothetical protein